MESAPASGMSLTMLVMMVSPASAFPCCTAALISASLASVLLG
jgi:hypothetical protein